MKRTARLPLLLLAVLLAFVGWAMPVQAAAEAEINYILRGMASIVPVANTDRVLVQSQQNGPWGVYTTAGEQVLPQQYDHLAYLGFGCYETGFSDNPLDNWKALVNADGEIISKSRYGIIRVYNSCWAVGWQVVAGTADDYDAAPGDNAYYKIEQCDVFWLGENPGLVKQLTGEAFLRAAAHGEYLSLEDREGNVTVYDRNFAPTGFAVAQITDPVYGLYNYAVMDLVTREIILDGVTACKEVDTDAGMIFQVTRTTYSGAKLNGICDDQGHWLMPLREETIVKADEEYAVLAGADKQQGLYSYAQGRLIVPCEYKSIYTDANAADAYVFYGYACGVKDGVRSYIDVETGEAASELTFNNRTMKSLGGTVYQTTGPDIYKFTSATGKTWYADNSQLKSTRGDGRLIVIYSVITGNYSVRTMDGDTVLDWLRKEPVITDDGKVVIDTLNEGCCLIELTW